MAQRAAHALLQPETALARLEVGMAAGWAKAPAIMALWMMVLTAAVAMPAMLSSVPAVSGYVGLTVALVMGMLMVMVVMVVVMVMKLAPMPMGPPQTTRPPTAAAAATAAVVVVVAVVVVPVVAVAAWVPCALGMEVSALVIAVLHRGVVAATAMGLQMLAAVEAPVLWATMPRVLLVPPTLQPTVAAAVATAVVVVAVAAAVVGLLRSSGMVARPLAFAVLRRIVAAAIAMDLQLALEMLAVELLAAVVGVVR